MKESVGAIVAGNLLLLASMVLAYCFAPPWWLAGVGVGSLLVAVGWRIFRDEKTK